MTICLRFAPKSELDFEPFWFAFPISEVTITDGS